MVKREQIPWTQLDGLLEKIRTAVEVADKLDRSEKLSAVAYNLDKACKILNIFVCKAEHSDALQLSGDVWRWTPFAINDEPFMVCVFERGSCSLLFDGANIEEDVAWAGRSHRDGDTLHFSDRTKPETATATEVSAGKRNEGVEVPLILTFGAPVGIALAQAMQQQKSDLVKEK